MKRGGVVLSWEQAELLRDVLYVAFYTLSDCEENGTARYPETVKRDTARTYALASWFAEKCCDEYEWPKTEEAECQKEVSNVPPK